MKFNIYHTRGSITMSDGHVFTADSPVNRMAHDLISNLYDKYAESSGVLRIQFSKSRLFNTFVLYVTPCDPDYRAELYDVITNAISQHMARGGRVDVRAPTKQWVQILNIESTDTPVAGCNADITEGDPVSINTETLQAESLEGLRDFF